MNREKIPLILAAVEAAMVIKNGNEIISLVGTPHCFSCVHCAHSTANAICHVLETFNMDPTEVVLDSGEPVFHKIGFASQNGTSTMYDWHPCTEGVAGTCKRPETLIVSIESTLWKCIEFHQNFVMPMDLLEQINASQKSHRRSARSVQCA